MRVYVRQRDSMLYTASVLLAAAAGFDGSPPSGHVCASGVPFDGTGVWLNFLTS